MGNRPDSPLFGSGIMRPIGGSPPRSGSVFEASTVTSDRIRKLASEVGRSEADFVKVGLVLAEILARAKRDGNHLAIVDHEGNLVQDIVGI
jgi:hypothetical protein